MSRWPGLNWRPFPSLTPPFLIYKRARLYLRLILLAEFSLPCQSFGRFKRHGLDRSASWRGLLTVIRDSMHGFPYKGQNQAIYHGNALPLSYIGALSAPFATLSVAARPFIDIYILFCLILFPIEFLSHHDLSRPLKTPLDA